MAILIDSDTRVLVTGLTGRIGSFHAQDMMDHGTNVVGGVTPGKGGTTHLGLPVFNTVKGAVAETGAELVVSFVPPPSPPIPSWKRRMRASRPASASPTASPPPT